MFARFTQMLLPDRCCRRAIRLLPHLASDIGLQRPRIGWIGSTRNTPPCMYTPEAQDNQSRCDTVVVFNVLSQALVVLMAIAEPSSGLQ